MIGPAVTETAKMVSAILVSSGVSTMVGYAAKASIPKSVPYVIQNSPKLIAGWKVFKKLAIPAGAAALAGMASEQAVKYSEKKIDENVEMVNNLEKTLAKGLKNVNDKIADKDAAEDDDK
jgi:predicted butyrate kinase (DUF1464 family)